MIVTDKQLAFMQRLADERQLSPEQGSRLTGMIDSVRTGQVELTRGKASEIIDWLVAQPVRPNATAGPTTGLDISGLEPGRYAIGDVLFLIQQPEAGRWSGWTFVKNGSEYADERFGSQKPGGTYWGSQADLLARIVEQPTEAMKHYGTITGRCAICNRTLEDEVSVARGIGPVCWERIAS